MYFCIFVFLYFCIFVFVYLCISVFVYWSRSELSEGNISLCCFGIHLQDLISAPHWSPQPGYRIIICLEKLKYFYITFTYQQLKSSSASVILTQAAPKIRNRFKTCRKFKMLEKINFPIWNYVSPQSWRTLKNQLRLYFVLI